MTRVVAALLAILLVAFVVWETTTINIQREYVLWAILIAPALMGAWFFSWIALRWNEPTSRRVIRSAFFGGAVVGLIGLLGGMILPIVVAPKANQGPMMGIFITGPLGILIGMVGGYFTARRKLIRPLAAESGIFEK